MDNYVHQSLYNAVQTEILVKRKFGGCTRNHHCKTIDVF